MESEPVTLPEVLERYRQQPSPPPGSSENPFTLRSIVEGPAATSEVEEAWRDHVLPSEAISLWAACRTARLFEDQDYGQWGLILLDPAASAARTAREREERPSEFHSDDIVVGEFLGDQELLVLAPSETGQRRMLVALPLDSRTEWFGAAQSIGLFLDQYFDHVGDKYWERQDVES